MDEIKADQMHALKQYIKNPDTVFITRDGTKVKIIDINDGSDEFPLCANIIGTDTNISLTASGSYWEKDPLFDENNEEHHYDIVDYEKPEQPQPTIFTVGEYVTRDGRKATVYHDLSEHFGMHYPLYGYIECNEDYDTWTIHGENDMGELVPEDLVGPWVENFLKGISKPNAEIKYDAE